MYPSPARVTLLLLVCFWARGFAAVMITEDHTKAGLTAVPEDLNPEVELLILNKNDIARITSSSLMNYPNLIELSCTGCGMHVIEDGAFDHNAKLKKLKLKSNKLSYIPADFGPATQSLEEFSAYRSMRVRLENLNFSTFPSLSLLQIGGNPLIMYDASNLPKTIATIYLPSANLEKMPDFSSFAPNIQKLSLNRNSFSFIPPESLMGLGNLTTLHFF